MPILDEVMEKLEDFTFYDSFRIPASHFNGHTVHLFRDPLSAKKSFLETNMITSSALPVGQIFTVSGFKIEFLNFPSPWDVVEFARKSVFHFSINKKGYIDAPARILLDKSSAHFPRTLCIDGNIPFDCFLTLVNPFTLDAGGSGLAGRLLMNGTLFRPVM